jgi:hypothetical protein
MKDNNLKEVFNSIFDSIIESENQETKKQYKDIINKLKNSNFNIEKPEIFDCMIKYQMEKVLNIVIDELCNSSNDKVQFLFNNYNFIKYHLEKLIVLKEGISCSADKSRHIILSYKDYLINNIIPKLKNEKHYNIFNFGEYQDWFDFCDSIYELYYGDIKDYLNIYKKLLNSEIRTYKTTHYFWYIKLKDKDYLFYDTFMKDHPLQENGELDLINSWAIEKREELDYPIWEKSEYFYVIPKNDIIECYCIPKDEII